MKNCNKINNNCGDIRPSACSEYEGDINEWSTLEVDSCKSVEEVLADIYDQLEQINLSELGESCLEYVKVEGKPYVKNVLLKLEEEICDIKTQIENLQQFNICNTSITSCNLDFGDLVLPCGDEPQTLVEVLQLILTQIQP